MNKDDLRNETGSLLREREPQLEADLSAIKQAEEKLQTTLDALRASEERFRSLMDLSPDIVSILNTEGILVYNSPAALTIHGYTQEEMIGRNTFNLIHPDDQAKCLAYTDLLFKNLPAPQSVQYRYLNKDGSYVWMEATASNQLDNPHIHGLIVISRDISERILAQKTLAEAKEVAEAGSRAKSEFLANMSHEIRTPITGIIGYTELLQDTPLVERQRDYLDIILASTENLLALVDDILDLSMIEAGKVTVARNKFSLRGVASEVIKNQSTKAKGKGLAIQTDIPSSVPDSLIGDQLRLKQILINLLGNAIKFTEKGDVVLSVAVEERQENSALLRIDVRDTGIGIRQEELSRIFLPFNQADASTTRKFGGSGLGLSICSRLTMLMGGDIWADSLVGAGSTFHVRLPFPVDHEESVALVSQTDLRPTAWEGPPLHILLVEDSESCRLYFAELLQRNGHRIDIAVNGIEALEKFQKNHLDLVLMDVQMPVMDGIEALAKLRDAEKVTGHHLPVIALTAHAMAKDRQKLLEKGFDGYVSKPCKTKDLFIEIRTALGLDAKAHLL